MHLVLAMNGEINQVRQMENWLSTRWLIFKFKHSEGESSIYFQLQLRYLAGLYELIFPKEHLQSILNTLNDPFFRGPVNFWLPFALIKKGLKLKSIPEIKEAPPILLPKDLAIRFYMIGIREDKIVKINEINTPDGACFKEVEIEQL